MGQYYNVAFKHTDENETKYSSRKVKGCDYIMAKLMEHSYFGNPILDAVANEIHNRETKLAWVGDYSDQDELNDITNGDVSYENSWGENVINDYVFPNKEFDYKDKYLVNKTKNVFIDFNKYLKIANDEYAINPISILTAIGNGRGGGDFGCWDKKMMNSVGTWAWDVITILDEKPNGMAEFDIVFKED